MSKYFVFSDVHGFFDEFMTALTEAGFDINNPDHILISCGDLCDRGSKSKEMLEFIMQEKLLGRRILIRGNHEDLMEEAICRREFWPHDIHNGTDKTAYQLTGLDPEMIGEVEILKALSTNDLWNSYVNSCIDFAEIGDHIIVHGWVPCFNKWDHTYYKDPNWRSGNWEKARWLNGMEAWNEGIRFKGKTIVCGHWSSSWGNARLHGDGREWLPRIETYYIDPETGKMEPHVNHDPFIDSGIVALDACTVISHQVNIYTFEN